MNEIKIIYGDRTETLEPSVRKRLILDPVEVSRDSFFKEGNNDITRLCLTERFVVEVLRNASSFLSVPPQHVTTSTLFDACTDHELALGFRRESLFTIDELLGVFVRLLTLQPAGEQGILSLEQGNRFYFLAHHRIASVKLQWNAHNDFLHWTLWYLPFDKEECSPGECIVSKKVNSSA